ncbi:hypothetical protein KUTeg_006238 [Tegillarca granosa]|uniref:Uncharacterized protein n=1 Tax=Tegillarca granosa TaxID=220873 RepID=A0ABQ9FFY7_TEGGR|nr:hypothetical protein KUTeg_006238 [Tegillarca granosa]
MARFFEMIRRKFLKSDNKTDKEERRNRNSQLQYEVAKRPRSYDEVELPDEDNPQDQYKVKKQPRSYDDVILDNEDEGGTTAKN